MMNRTATSSLESRAMILAASVLVVAALYLARDVLIPLTLAILFTFLLNPLVLHLRRWGVAHIPAVAIVGSAAVLLLLGLAGLVTMQVIDLVDHLPEYTQNAQQKIRLVIEPLQGWAGRAMDGVSALTSAPAGAGDSSASASAPVTKVIHDSSYGGMLVSAVTAFVVPIGTLAVVIVLMGAMLIQGGDLRDRFVRLIGDSRISVTTKAMDDVAERVGRYLLMQSIINGSGAIVIGVGLLALGVPGAAFWGLLWGALRFLPYVGPWMGALMPIVVSLGQSTGWSQPLLTIALLVVVEIVTNMIIEPWLYGTGTGLSPLAVLASAIFWAWLWGWAGLLLATPITVCLAVLGRYVPQLEYLHILLGDEPVLRPSARLYQRLLSGQEEDAREILESELNSRPSAEVFDDVLVRTLARIDDDLDAGNVNHEQAIAIWALLEQVIKALPPVGSSPNLPAVGCLYMPARDEADVLCGQMLKRVLAERGVELEVADSAYLANEKAELIAERRPAVVLVSALGPAREPYLRHALRRIASKVDSVVLVAAVWNAKDRPDDLQFRIGDSVGAVVVTSVADALNAVRYAIPSRNRGSDLNNATAILRQPLSTAQ